MCRCFKTEPPGSPGVWTPSFVAALCAVARCCSLVLGTEQSFVADHHLVLLFWGSRDFLWWNTKSPSCLATQAKAQSYSKGHELTCQGHFFKRSLIEGQPVAIKVCNIHTALHYRVLTPGSISTPVWQSLFFIYWWRKTVWVLVSVGSRSSTSSWCTMSNWCWKITFFHIMERYDLKYHTISLGAEWESEDLAAL